MVTRRGVGAACVSTTLVACSLFVDLSGLSGANPSDDGGIDDSSVDGIASGDGSSDANVDPPSCAGGGGGTCAGGNCCESTIVPGSSFNRGNNPSAPAVLTDFRLDRFKVTVGRFRAFVASGHAINSNAPAVGAGAYPPVAGSGWDASWNAFLPVDASALSVALKCDANGTWSDTPGANESRPMTCVNWYLAFAFCVWDGARLPTEAEWDYAASGGSEQRYYPWSVPPSSTTIDSTYANYGCNAPCPVTSITPPGTFSPKGDGKWGQADLVGSVLEWQFDWGDPNPYPTPCNDCARIADLADGGSRADRAAAFIYGANYQVVSRRNSDPPNSTGQERGLRCARNL